MSQLHGKQLRNESTSLNKLNGTGLVAFTTGATMSFGANASLKVDKVPTTNNDVVNKAYVDSVATGLDVKQSARAIAHDVVTILDGVRTVDGVSLVNGDRVVVNGQDGKSATASNGIYIVNSNGAWTRSEDFDESEEITGGQFIFITEGTKFADTGFVVSTPDAAIQVGVGGIKFTQFSSAGVIQAGVGLSQTGNTFNVNVSTGLEIVGDNVRIANTNVSTGSQGSATSVSTFTANAQGQLTAAGSTAIAIPSTQVTDFGTAAETAVFQPANFIDSTTIDFTTAGGTSVTADIKDTIAGTGLTFTSGKINVNAGDGIAISNDNVAVDPSIAGTGLTFTSGKINVNAGDGIAISNDNVVVDLANNSGLTLAGALANNNGKLAVDPSIAGTGLTFTSGKINVNAGDGIAISDDNVVVDLANNSGLTLAGNKLAVNPAIAGTGLTFTSGVLSLISGSAASPSYLTFAGNASKFVLDKVVVNNFSRLQAFINGLEVSIGGTGGGLGEMPVAGIPEFKNQVFAYDGSELLFQPDNAKYTLDANDEVRVVFEKN